MGQQVDLELLAWLEGGGRVVAANERAVRALAAEYHSMRRARCETAWPSPRIDTWTHFLTDCWRRLSANGQMADLHMADGRMILSPLQEQTLWTTVVGTEASLATTLEASRRRLGRMAMEAHALVASYAPRVLDARTRTGWQRDQAAFSRWLSGFETACRQQQLLSPARLPLELLPLLEVSPASERETVLITGFDRLEPVQRQFLDAWGSWRELPLASDPAELHFYAADDEKTELAACARWCHAQLDRNPEARLLVIAQNQRQLRGALERAFLTEAGPDAPSLLEFSLGVPLASTAMVRAAQHLLRWLTDPIEENALDALVASGYATSSPQEQSAVERRMMRLRQRGRQRTAWPLDAFLNERCEAAAPSEWSQRMLAARALLAERRSGAVSPLLWAELVPRLLALCGWPGSRPLTSAEFQIQRRLQEALDACASLGAVSPATDWNGFRASLESALEETLYAPESANAPILIAGPAETAGLTADAVWFLCATEDGWPATGSTHPLLPLNVQREARMPHAHPRVDWELAETITRRLASSAAELVFSYARQSAGTEAQPSRLALHFAGAPSPLPAELRPAQPPAPLTVVVEDPTRIPYPPGSAPGGSELITNQSACPFRAFASARLSARGWDAAEAGLTAAQRGTLLHAILHAVWAGLPDGIRSQADLLKLADRGLSHRKDFVLHHVERVFVHELPASAREQMPRRYIDLEKLRLTDLIDEWLAYESTRVEFTVAATELNQLAVIDGLALNLRLDRVDRLNDGTELIVDYKTGSVTPKSWENERPEDPQLPLYAAFGRSGAGEQGGLGGLVFAKVRRGEPEFAGRVGLAAETLLPGLKGTSALVKAPFTAEMLLDWQDRITALAHEFVEGKAEVDPREFPKTCEHCDLPGLCRVRDFPSTDHEDDADNEESADA